MRAAWPYRRATAGRNPLANHISRAAGIREGWLYDQNMLLVQAEIKMIECSQRVVLLADSGKFGQRRW